MARISVEQYALVDSRYEVLGRLLGTNRHEALGRMIVLWNECQERERYTLPVATVKAALDREDGPELLVQAELGSWNYPRSRRPIPVGTIRIRGTKGRIEWLKKRRQDGRKGGRPRLAEGNPTVIRRGRRTENPPAPAPAPTQKRESTSSGRALGQAPSTRPGKTRPDMHEEIQPDTYSIATQREVQRRTTLSCSIRALRQACHAELRHEGLDPLDDTTEGWRPPDALIDRIVRRLDEKEQE